MTNIATFFFSLIYEAIFKIVYIEKDCFGDQNVRKGVLSTEKVI